MNKNVKGAPASPKIEIFLLSLALFRSAQIKRVSVNLTRNTIGTLFRIRKKNWRKVLTHNHLMDPIFDLVGPKTIELRNEIQTFTFFYPQALFYSFVTQNLWFKLKNWVWPSKITDRRAPQFLYQPKSDNLVVVRFLKNRPISLK